MRDVIGYVKITFFKKKGVIMCVDNTVCDVQSFHRHH